MSRVSSNKSSNEGGAAGTGKRINGPVIRLHSNDNVVVARTDVGLGASIPGENVVSRAQVGAGYKIATRHIAEGDPILKYNTTIGLRRREYPAGQYGSQPQRGVQGVRARL